MIAVRAGQTPHGHAGCAILAVDGGGTHTRAVLLTRDADVLAHASGPGCNPFDRPEWARNLHDLLPPMRRPGLRAATSGLAGHDAARPPSPVQQHVPLSLIPLASF